LTSRSAQATTVFSSALVQGLVSVAFPASAAVLRGQGLTDAQYGSIFLPQMALAAVPPALAALLAVRAAREAGARTRAAS
jgi:hypothetical protein